MNYLDFRNSLVELGCFSINQAKAVCPNLSPDSITRWIKKGYIVKLRQGYYAFKEVLSNRDFAFYISNKIYNPSYVSFHTALSFYGMIPESVSVITAATTLKTAEFDNDFGLYKYHKISSSLFWGYDLKPFGSKTIMFASPEKALLDLLYLYPFYDSPDELSSLRLDEDYMEEDFDVNLFLEYASKFGSKSLSHRGEMLVKTYGI